MSKKQTMRLSLITAAVLVVLLCLVGVFALNVSNDPANAMYEPVIGDIEIELEMDLGSGFEAVSYGDYTGDYTGTNALELDLGTVAASKVNASFQQVGGDAPIPLATDIYYTKWDESESEYVKLINPGYEMTHAGRYQLHWFIEGDQNEDSIAYINFVVNPHEFMLTVDDYQKYYDGEAIAPTFSCMEAVFTQDFTVEITWDTDNGQAPVLPGTYDYTLTLALKPNAENVVSDYVIDTPSGQVNIWMRKLDYDFADNLVYNGQPQNGFTPKYHAMSGNDTDEVLAALPSLDGVIEYVNTYDWEDTERVYKSTPGSHSSGIIINDAYRDRYYLDIIEHPGEDDEYIYEQFSTQTIIAAPASDANAILAFGGDFGTEFQYHENYYWGSDDIYDRIVIDYTKVPGYNDGGTIEINSAAIWNIAQVNVVDATEDAAANPAWTGLDGFDFSGANIGETYTIRVELMGNNCYNTGYVYFVFTVAKIRLFIVPTTDELEYRGVDQAPTSWDFHRYKVGIDVDSPINFQNTTVQHENVGEYYMSCEPKSDYIDKANYEFYQDDNAKYTIIPATLTPAISIVYEVNTNWYDTDSRVYGQAFATNPTGVEMAGDDTKPEQGIDETITFRYSADNGESWTEWAEYVDMKLAGKYQFKYNFSCSGIEIDDVTYVNYVSAGETAAYDFEITKADLTVTVTDGQTKEYGEEDPASFTYGVTGAVYSETPVFTGALSRDAGEDVDEYDIIQNTLALTDGTNETVDYANNYSIVFVNTSKFSITKADLTVTTNDEEVTFNDNVPDYTASYSGWKFGEGVGDLGGALDFTSTYVKGSPARAEGYAVTPKELTSDNYNIIFVPGYVYVSAKPVVVALTVPDLAYSGSAKVITGKYVDVNSVEQNATLTLIDGDDNVNAGTFRYIITIADTNYAIDTDEAYALTKISDDPETYAFVASRTITTVNATWTAPTAAENLVYNGNAQNLLVAPTNVVGGTVEYFNGGNWSETMPTGTNAGSYEGLKVRIAPDGNHNAIESSTFDVTIDQYTVVPTFTLDGSAFTADTNITYDGKTYTIAATATVNLTIAQEQVEKTITFGNATAELAIVGNTTLTINAGVYGAQGDAQNNYKVTAAVTSAKLTIDPKAIEYKQQYKLGTNNWADYDSYVTYAAAEYTFRVVPTNKIGSDDVYFLLTEEETQTGTDANIYEYTLTIAGEDKGNYSFTSTDVDFDIFEYNISGKLTVTNVNATYDGQAHTWSIKVLADAGVPGITEDWTIASGTVTNVADSGSYTLEDVWFGTNNYANYEIDEDVVVTYTITKAPSDWSKGVARKTGLIYNGDNQELLTAGTAVGGTAKYRLGDKGEWDTSIPVAKNAGTYYVYYMIVGDANHNDLAADNYEVTIGKKAATITVNNSNRTYGQALSIDVTDSGILDADKALAYSTIVLAYDAENKSVSPVMDITTANVGTYYILVGTGDDNYDFTINYVNGTSIDVKPTPEADPIATEVCTYTINNAAAEITADPQGIANLIYTGAAIVLVTDGTAVGGSFMYKVDDSAWLTAENVKATNAGTHTIVYKVVGDANYSDLVDDENYTFTVTIAKRGVVVTLSEPASYVYSAGAKELTGTYKTWADGAETNVTAAATVSLKDGDDNVNVGTFHYIISIDDGNYTVAEAANASIYAYDNDSEKWIATRAVTAADLANASVAQNGALTYNGGDQTANVTTEGATTIGSNAISYVYSESLTGTYTAAVPAFTTAGEHTVYYTASADNHNDYAGTFTVTIAKKALTIKADNKNVEYGENAPAFTYSFDGLVNNETDAVLEDVASISLSCSYVAQPTPGTYTAAGTTCDINVAGSVTADNYAISYEKGTLTVDKRALTLNINHVEVEYGKNARSYCGYTVAEGGIIDGADVLDNDNVYYYIDSFDEYELFDNAVGASGSISFNYSSAPTVVNNNYRIDTVNNGTWTIVKKNVNSGITIEVGELTYNGTEQTVEITVTYGDRVLVEGVDYTVLSGNAGTDAGNYNVTIQGIGDNYTGTLSQGWTIAPKPITVVNVNEEHLEVVYGDAETLQATNPAAYIGLKDGFALAEGDTLAEIIAVSVDVNGNPVQSLEDVWNVNKYYLHVYDEFDEIKFDSNYTVTVELDEETAYLEIVKRPITIAYTKNEKVQIVFDPGAYIEYELTSLVMENYSLFELIEGSLAYGDNDLSGVITIYSEEFEAFVETIQADFSNYFKVLGTYAIDVKDEQGNYEITLVEDANCAFEIVERPLYVVPADGQSKIYGEVDGEIVYIDLLTDNWTYDNVKQEWVCTRETIFKGNAPVAPVAPEGEEIVDVPDPEDYENDEEGYQAAMEAFSAWEDYREAVELYEQQLAIYEAEIAAYRALIFGLLEGNLGRVEGENAGAYAITIGNLHFKALPAEPVAQPVYDEYVADLPEEPEEPEEPAELAELEAYEQAYAEWLEQYDAAIAEYNAAVAAYQEYGTLVGYKAFYELRIDEVAKYYTIGAKAITVTAADKTSVYGDAIATLTATDTGIVAGDEASDVYTLAKAAGNNVGTYAITVVPANNANYVVTGVPAVYTITAKAITVTAENKQSAYGDAIATLTATADLVGDDVASEVYTLTKAAGNNVGTYAITVNVANNANYVVTAVNGTYTITKKAITFSLYVDGVAVNGTDAIKVYDGQQHTFVIKALGAGNEIITLSTEDLTTVASVTASFEPGDFAADGAQVENYVLAQGATFNYGISAKPIDAIVYKIDGVVKNSVEYDGQNHGVIAYATDVEGNLFEIGGGPGKEAGSYTVTVEAGSYNDNYVLAETATFAWSITEKAAVVDPETGAKDYAKEISDKDAASDTGVNVTDLFKKADSEKTDDVESEVTITIKSGEGEEAKTGTIVFDKAAIAQLAGAVNVALKVNVTSDVEEIAEIVAVKETLKGAEMVINVSLGNATFESGKATLTFDFDKQAPKGMIGKVYYVDADGNRTDMKATFANGKVTFETTHFSDYIVVFEKAPGLSGGAIAGIVIACVVVAAGIAVGIFFLLKKKKGNGGSATTAGEAAATETAAE